ncbi:hypothetical protein [Cellvibrio sp. UBA7671]|uniref:hypothetical protein n=1 Tax=Cellvibrio sp. UBA7671 TaxID=1946312 RepID=UPI002F35D1CB
MDKQISRIVDRNKPELVGMYHLPVFARVESVCDPVLSPALSEKFRTRYAVDVVVLDENDLPDALFPVFKAVPLPASCAGLERGVFGFPEAGAIVEMAFAYGLPSKPFIRTILTDGLSLPAVAPGELLLQAGTGVFQRANVAGNWERSTNANITDDCLRFALHCYSATTTAHEFFAQVKRNSTEQVLGTKIIEALGALKLLSGGVCNIAAADNLNLTTASDCNVKVARDLQQRIGNIADSFAVLKQLIKVQNGGTVWLGSEGENVLQILSELIQLVANIANIAKDHTHEYTDNGNPLKTKKPDQSGAYGGEKTSADALKSRLDPIVE